MKRVLITSMVTSAAVIGIVSSGPVAIGRAAAQTPAAATTRRPGRCRAWPTVIRICRACGGRAAIFKSGRWTMLPRRPGPGAAPRPSTGRPTSAAAVVYQPLSTVGGRKGQDARRQGRPVAALPSGRLRHAQHQLVWRRLRRTDHPDPEVRDHADRDLPQLQYHPDRRQEASRRCRTVVPGRLRRPLGGRYAGRRQPELHRHELDVCGRQRLLPFRRAAHRRALPAVARTRSRSTRPSKIRKCSPDRGRCRSRR